MQRCGQTQQIKRTYANDAAARAVDVRNEEEREPHDKWQHQEQAGFHLGVMRAVTDQQVAPDGDPRHQAPCRERNPVPPRGLRVSLRIQHIVHSRDGQSNYGCRLRSRRNFDERPQLGLLLGGLGIDSPKLLRVARRIEQDTLVEVGPKQRTDLCRIRRRYTEAEELYRRALPVWAKLLTPQQYAAKLSDLSALYRADGRSSDAAAMEADARTVLQKAGMTSLVAR